MINIVDTTTNGPLWLGDFRVKSPQHYISCSYIDCAYNHGQGECRAEVVKLTHALVQIDGEIIADERCDSFLSKQMVKDGREVIKEYEENLLKENSVAKDDQLKPLEEIHQLYLESLAKTKT